MTDAEDEDALIVCDTGKDLVWSNETGEDLAADSSLSLGSLLASLSAALDLTEGQPMGHAVRTCLIALRIAETLGLSAVERANLHLASLLKDSGCSSNAARMFAIFGCDDIEAKGDSKIQDWCRLSEAVKFAVSHTMPQASAYERLRKLSEILRLPGRVMDVLTEARCTRGAEISRSLGMSDEAADAVYSLDEHWDGQGAPHHVRGEEIPLLGRILCLAQTMEVFATTFGAERAYSVTAERAGSWFDPALVRAAGAFRSDDGFWAGIRDFPQESLATATENLYLDCVSDVDAVCRAFAGIVDAKSSFTAAHSSRVARVAMRIGRRLGLSKGRCRRLYRAGLLHDLGKLAVPNIILDKPGRLTDQEMAVIMRHPGNTQIILQPIPGFDGLTAIAAAHHERLDGSGYHRGLRATDLTLEMRILAVADVYDSLSSDRPYRPALTAEQIAGIMSKEAESHLDPVCVEALRIG